MDANAVEVMRTFNEDDLFLRGLTSWMGFKQTGIEFTANERLSGESSYNLKKMITFAFTGITAFSVKPLYIAAYLGFFFPHFQLSDTVCMSFIPLWQKQKFQVGLH
jgi:dolichol-phosphate mannosyltransferase